jgi:hypothetical protein
MRVEAQRDCGCDFHEGGERRGDGEVDPTVRMHLAWSLFFVKGILVTYMMYVELVASPPTRNQ